MDRGAVNTPPDKTRIEVAGFGNVHEGTLVPNAHPTIIHSAVPPSHTTRVRKVNINLQHASLPIQDLSNDRLLRDAPRLHLKDQLVPSLGGIPLLAKLGQGGMGAVYYGINPRLEKEVAVKVLPMHMDNPEMVERFYREAQIAAKISSPHLVSVYDVNEENGLFYLVMDFVSGKTAGGYLQQVKESGRPGLPEDEALDICIAATNGLLMAHQQNIIHRDIKPDNILIPKSKEGDRLLFAECKVADLGLARSTDTDTGLTAMNAAMGTPGFLAPEQAIDARHAGPPADVFSLGATLYTLLCGRPPFHGESVMGIVMATISTPHEPARNLRPDLGGLTHIAIDTCLRKKPEERYKDGAALIEMLKRCKAAVDKRQNPTVMKASGAVQAAIAHAAPAPEAPQYAIRVEPAKQAPAPNPVVKAPAPAAPMAKAATPPPPPAPAVHTSAQKTAPSSMLLNAPRDVSHDPPSSKAYLQPGATREETLAKLLEQIKNNAKGEMLAISGFMSEVQMATKSENSTGQRIAALITKDVALTKSLLKTVNSSYYSGASSQRIASISHAVLMLGVETVSHYAACQAVFESFGKRGDIKDLKRMTLHALMTGTQAREIARSTGLEYLEHGMLAGMMYNIGILTLASYLPNQYGRVQRVASIENLNPDVACERVLGVNFREIGHAVAKAWNFPERITESIQGLGDSEVPERGNKKQQLRAAIACANELTTASMLEDPAQRSAAMKKIQDRYVKFIPVNEKILAQAANHGQAVMKNLGPALGVPIVGVPKPGTSGRTAAAGAAPAGAPLPPPYCPEELTRLSKEIAAAMHEHFDLNEMFMKIMEAMVQGAGFDQALMTLLNTSKDRLLGRLGFGYRGEEICEQFEIPLDDDPPNPLGQVILSSREIVIQDISSRTGLPEGIVELTKPKCLILLPIILDGKSIGALYGQRSVASGEITEMDKQHVRALRNLTAQAMRAARRQ